MLDGIGIKTRPHILVLEGNWSDDLHGSTSIRPLLEGWSINTGVRVGFRPYHRRDDLVHWLTKFAQARTNPHVCYIAGHGSGNRLYCMSKCDINLKGVIEAAFPRKTGPAQKVGPKGLLLGSCDVGSEKQRHLILESTGRGLRWIAGYQHSLPWMESTLCDLLFLTYFFQGRCQRQTNQGPFVQRGGQFVAKNTSKAATIAGWLSEDYPLSTACGFGATDR